VQEKKEKIVAAASDRAALTYRQQRTEAGKEERPVLTLSAQAQNSIAKRIMTAFTSFLAPKMSMKPESAVKDSGRAQTQQRQEPKAPQPKPASRTEKGSIAETRKPVSTSPKHEEQKRFASTTSAAEKRKQALDAADESRRRKTESAEKRLEHARGQDPTIQSLRQKEEKKKH
jgi:vacuolar-type H+-ATPase subunit H